MRAKFSLVNQDNIEASLTITMTLEQWEKLRGQLVREWPSARLSTAICNLVHEARQHFYKNDEDALK